MIGIIWYNQNNMEKAIEQLDKIKLNYLRLLRQTEDNDYKDIIVQEKRSSKNWVIIFTNNDIWKIIAAKDNVLGAACNISYIDCDISQEIVHSIILPCTKALPFQAYRYY